jgi:hypothetical protein
MASFTAMGKPEGNQAGRQGENTTSTAHNTYTYNQAVSRKRGAALNQQRHTNLSWMIILILKVIIYDSKWSPFYFLPANRSKACTSYPAWWVVLGVSGYYFPPPQHMNYKFLLCCQLISRTNHCQLRAAVSSTQ